MSTKVVPNETPKEIPIYVVLRNPEPILISIFSDGQPQPSFPLVSLRNNHLLPSFSSVILSSNYAMTEEGPTIKMDRGIRWEFDPGGLYFHYLYSFSSHPDSLIQPLILALDFAYAKVVEPILNCTFSLFSLKLVRAEIYRPRPSRSRTSSVYTMIEDVCRLAGLGKRGVLHGLLSAIRSPRVLIRGNYLVHVVRTCYTMYLSGLSGTNRALSKIASALIAGNSIMLKPPTQSVVAALYMVHCFHLAGLPKGLISCVTGRGSEIGEFLTMQPGNCIGFTGGDTGIAISKTVVMVLFSMEVRGKDACIVLKDANLDLVAANVIKGGFSYYGQRCTAVKVISMMESVANTLVEKVKARVAKWTVGPPEVDCDTTLILQQSKVCKVVRILSSTCSIKCVGTFFCAGRGTLKGPMIIGGLHYMFKQNFEDDQSLVNIMSSSKQITIILWDCLMEMRETICYENYFKKSWLVFNMSDELLERVLHLDNAIFSILIVVIKDGEDLYTMSCIDTEAKTNSGFQVVGTMISAPQLFPILRLRVVLRWEGINLLKIWKYHWINKQILWPFDRGKGKDVVEMLSARFTFVFSTLETKIFAEGQIDEVSNLHCSYHGWSFNGCGSSVAKMVAAKGSKKGGSAIIIKSQVAICVVLANSKNKISFQSLFGLSFRHCKEI